MLGVPGAPQEPRRLIQPTPGLMLFWPSWLKHMVHPFRGEGERISIAYNLRIRSG